LPKINSMRYFHTIITVLLALAIVVLFYLQFSNTNNDSLNKVFDNPQEQTPGDLKIVYVNTDSLWDKYEFISQLKEELGAEKLKLEGQYNAEVKKFEKEYIAFQNQIQYLSIPDAQSKEAELMEKQQYIMQMQERLNMNFMQYEQEKNIEIQEKITSFLDGYAKQNNYQLVFGYGFGGNVLFAANSLDVTNDVLTLLNQQYQAETKK
jgi:outer membrane protein